MAKSSTTIDSDNRKSLPARGKGKKSLMLDAIKDVCGSEQEFLKQVISIGMGGVTKISSPDEDDEFEYKQPNTMLLNMVLNRIEPPLKAIAPMVEFDFNPDAKPHEQANQILKAVSNSQIAPDIGQMFVGSIKSMIDIEEYTDLKERIEKLEKALSGES